MLAEVSVAVADRQPVFPRHRGDTLTNTPRSVVGDGVDHHDDAFGVCDTPEKESVGFGEGTSTDG